MILKKVKDLHEILGGYTKEDKARLGILSPLDITRIKKTIQRGKWSILIYAAHNGQTATYGLKIIPFLSGYFWPAVDIMPYMESETRHSSMLVRIEGSHVSLLQEYRNSCEKYLDEWDSYYNAISPIYKHFGGEDDLSYLKGIVFNNKNWPQENISKEEEILRWKAYCLEKDPSESNHFFWNFFEKIKRDKNYIPELPIIDLGIYSDKIRSAIASRARIRSSYIEFYKIQELLMQSVMYTHGFDTTDFNGSSSGKETSRSVFAPLEILFADYNGSKLKEEIKSMPEFYIAEKMNEMQGSYNGVAHMEIAALMDDQYNDPKKCWTYLVSAGYWAGINLPEAQPEIIKAAIQLCERQNWNEAAEVLKYNLDILESA